MLMDKPNYRGPVVLVIMDGLGISSGIEGNAVLKSHTEFLDKCISDKYVRRLLDASGEAVGIVAGQMGNSEVGHNTIGCGQIIKQGVAKIEDAIQSGAIWQTAAWQGAIGQLDKDNNTLHFAGIFSDGGVHSDIKHLEVMIQKAIAQGVKKIRIHAVFDGRDVAPNSEPKYIERIEKFARQFEGTDIKIASGGGRMVFIADRYENDWSMVELGWRVMFEGKTENRFQSATSAIGVLRKVNPDVQDQYLPAFVIVDENNNPVGNIKKGDSFIYYDFRGDRAIEIARAFTEKDFDKFDRGDYNPEDVFFAGMTEYDSDTHTPANQLIPPVNFTNTLNQVLSQNGISQLAISETVKFGHVTYYFNGNSYEKTPGEEHIEIKSDTIPFTERPWMKSADLADEILKQIEQPNAPRFVRVNFPNPDMVGHFADMETTVTAIEAMDIALARIAKKIDELGGCMVLIADHGNAEELIDENGEPKTSHTTNQVPFIIYDNTENRSKYGLAKIDQPGLSNIAATIATLLGVEALPAEWQKSLIVLK